MLTLSLLRHTKSSWKSPTQDDYDRSLASRGEADAPRMGNAMAKRGIEPELVLCSSARRTRETLALVLPELRAEPKVIYAESLYHAAPASILQMLQGISAGASQVLLVGHNPVLHALALDLVGSGPKHIRDRLATKLPTGGLVVITFPVSRWRDIAVNTGQLTLFLTPREVEKT